MLVSLARPFTRLSAVACKRLIKVAYSSLSHNRCRLYRALECRACTTKARHGAVKQSDCASAVPFVGVVNK